MSMTFTAEQDEFRKSVRRFLTQKSSLADVRQLMETDEGYDPAVWRQMAEQLLRHRDDPSYRGPVRRARRRA